MTGKWYGFPMKAFGNDNIIVESLALAILSQPSIAEVSDAAV